MFVGKLFFQFRPKLEAQGIDQEVGHVLPLVQGRGHDPVEQLVVAMDGGAARRPALVCRQTDEFCLERLHRAEVLSPRPLGQSLQPVVVRLALQGRLFHFPVVPIQIPPGLGVAVDNGLQRGKFRGTEPVGGIEQIERLVGQQPLGQSRLLTEPDGFPAAMGNLPGAVEVTGKRSIDHTLQKEPLLEGKGVALAQAGHGPGATGQLQLLLHLQGLVQVALLVVLVFAQLVADLVHQVAGLLTDPGERLQFRGHVTGGIEKELAIQQHLPQLVGNGGSGLPSGLEPVAQAAQAEFPDLAHPGGVSLQGRFLLRVRDQHPKQDFSGRPGVEQGFQLGPGAARIQGIDQLEARLAFLEQPVDLRHMVRLGQAADRGEIVAIALGEDRADDGEHGKGIALAVGRLPGWFGRQPHHQVVDPALGQVGHGLGGQFPLFDHRQGTIDHPALVRGQVQGDVPIAAGRVVDDQGGTLLQPAGEHLVLDIVADGHGLSVIEGSGSLSLLSVPVPGC